MAPENSKLWRALRCVHISRPLPFEEHVGMFTKRLHAYYNLGQICTIQCIELGAFPCGFKPLLCQH